MRYCPLATPPSPPLPSLSTSPPSIPPPPGGEPNPVARSHNQISSHQKASEQTAGPFSWYSITDAAGRNYLCVPAPVPASPPAGWASSYRVVSCKRSSKTKITCRTQLLLSPISLFSLSLFVGASWWPSFWPFSAPIHCGRSAAHSAAGASRSIIHNPRATRRVPATPRPSTVAAIRFIIRRHHTQR